MKRYLKVPIIAILSFIVIVLGIYTIISFKTSLVGFVLNIYLKKYGLYQNFKNMKVNSSSSLSIDGFFLKKKNVSIKANKLRFWIDKLGRINLALEKPVITVVLKKTNKSSKGFAVPPLKIGSVDLNGLTLKIKRNDKEIVNINNATLKLTNSTLAFAGRVFINTNNIFMDGDIHNLSCTYSLFKNGVAIRNIKILPNRLSLKTKDLQFQADKQITIKNVAIKFFPFSVSISGLKGNVLSQFKGIKVSCTALVDYQDRKATFVLKGVKVIGKPLGAGSVKAKISFDKRMSVSALFDNLTSDLDDFVSQDIRGSLTYDGVVRIKILGGQAIAFNNVFFDFTQDPLKVSSDPSRTATEVSLGDLFKSTIKRIADDSYRFSFFTDNLTSISKFLSDSLDVQVFRDIHLEGEQLARIFGAVNTKTRSFVALAQVSCGALLYKNLKFFNVNAQLPLVVNSNALEKGNIKIGRLELEGYTFPLHLRLKSTNNEIFVHFYPIKTQEFDLKPFNLRFDVNKKTLAFSKIKARIFTRLSKIFIDLSGKYSDGILKTLGTVRAKVFDGSVKIKDISLKLKDVPIVSMNVTFDHLNLKKITQNTNFGLITGFIKGYIKNLSLVNFKYPLSFTAKVETEDVKGVSKRISLKAVNSISSVGGGVASIAVPFFKSFPYSTIGFTATLKNGKFEIHGLYKSKDKEYIIKKGFLIGIDVVNMNRNNSIAWGDFVNRIKRVLRGGSK